jgi:hypothetical protein
MEYYIGDAFSPRSYGRIAARLRGSSTEKGLSLIQTRVGRAEVSIFRSGGVLVKGATSAEEARGIANRLGMQV